jgi:hypothetical protein
LKNPIEEMLQTLAQRYHKYMPIWLALGISAAGAPTVAQTELISPSLTSTPI